MSTINTDFTDQPTGRQILIMLDDLYDGDWHAIYNHIVEKRPAPTNYAALEDERYFTTLLDDDYPEERKYRRCPPFVLERDADEEEDEDFDDFDD